MTLRPYKELTNSFRTYWMLYGGWRALLTSPYFHLAVLITIACAPVWVYKPEIWAAATVNILPNLLGFTVAGLAVFLAFSHPETMVAITEGGEPRSFFVSTVAVFVHFIVVQTLALLFGVVGQHFTNVFLAGLGTLLLVYAILGSLAMGMQLLHTSRIINAAFSLPKKTVDRVDKNGDGQVH